MITKLQHFMSIVSCLHEAIFVTFVKIFGYTFVRVQLARLYKDV